MLLCLHFLLNSPYWFLLCPCTQNAFVQLTGDICGAKTNGQCLGPHFTFYLTYFSSLTHFLPGCSTLLTLFLTLCSTLSGPLLVALFFIILSCWSFQEMVYFLEPQNSFLWPFFYLHFYTWTSSLNFCLSSCMSHRCLTITAKTRLLITYLLPPRLPLPPRQASFSWGLTRVSKPRFNLFFL